MVFVVVGHDGADEESPQVLRAGSAAASGGGAGGSSSSPCSESNFRELDDVFLQTQARIWLGEVLQTRLDEQLPIADLLADGELLFKVSRAVWKMLSMKHMELRYVKAYKFEPFASRSSSGSRYMPYSNVDSFLKICKILGLAGIDLFSPSDVVEKRDTRKVCMCIRSLSKKARSRHLNVPDFDIVTYTIAMPTDMVGNIRRSWELSHSSFPRSASKTPPHEPRQRSRQKHSNATSGGNDDSYFEESADVESAFMLESGSSSSSCSNDISSQTNSDAMDSPGVSSLVKGYPSGKSSFELEDQDKHRDECSKCQWQEDCLNESTRSLCSQHLENDHQLDSGLSPSFAESNIYLGSRSFHTENGAIHNCENSGKDLIHVDHSLLEDDASVVGDSGDCSTPRRKHSDDLEVSSTASMSSVSGPVRNLNFEDQLDEEDDFKTIWFRESPNKKVAFFIKKSIEKSESPDKVIYNTSGDSLTTYCEEESLFDMKVMDIGFSYKLSLTCSDALVGYSDHATLHKCESCMSQVNTNLGSGDNRDLFADWSSFSHEFHQWDRKGKCRISVAPTRASSPSLPLIDSPEENLHSVRSKPTGNALRLANSNIKYIIGGNEMEGHNGTMVESDPDNGKQPNKCLETTCFNSIENKTYKESDSPNSVAAMVESEKSLEFDSRDDGSGLQQLCDTSVSCCQGEQKPDEHSCSTKEYSENVTENSDHVSIDQKKDMICSTENKDQAGDVNREKVQIPAVEDSNITENLSVGKADSKPPRRPLLKTVATGTAVVGVLLFLLHFGKKDGEKTGEPVKQPNRQRKKENGRNFSSAKGSRREGVYSAEKLRFGVKRWPELVNDFMSFFSDGNRRLQR